MEIFRYGHDVYGEPVIDGLSWSLLEIAVGTALAVIALHFLFRAFTRKRS